MNHKYLRLVSASNLALLASGALSDFRILLEDAAPFRCHRLVLLSGSEFFRAFFAFDASRSELCLAAPSVITAAGLRQSLLFMYGLGCDYLLPEELCEDTYVAADYLQIAELKTVASKMISGSISVATVFGIIHFSITFNDNNLKMNARNFINNNFDKLSFDNKDFLLLSFDVLSEIVSDKNLSSTDFIIMKAILTWVNYDPQARRDFVLNNIDKLVQLHLISTEQWNVLFSNTFDMDLTNDIKKMTSPLKFYSDAHHRLGTPIVLYGIGSRRPDMLDWSNNFFYVDQTIERLSSMREDRINHKICSSSTFIFVIGGESTEGFIFKSCERYNLVEKKWEGMAELDCHRSNFTVACLEGFVYLFGGNTVEDDQAGCTPSKDILIYDSGSDFWRKLSFQTISYLVDAVAVGHCNYIYIVGGLNDSGHPINKISEFDPANGDWTSINTAGLPEEIFSESNIQSLSATAGGWSSENEGFLLLSGRVRDWTSIFVYHFSLNRWRLSLTLEGFPQEFLLYKKVLIYCERDFIGLVSPATTSLLESYRLQEPPSDSIHDEMLLYVKFHIRNDWSGELDMINFALCKPLSLRPGYQFLLSPLVLD